MLRNYYSVKILLDTKDKLVLDWEIRSVSV